MSCVCIKYNGILLAPTPLISLSRSFQEVGGRHVGSTLTVKLEGKIVAGTLPRAGGIQDFINRYPCSPSNPLPASVVGIANTGAKGLLEEEDRVRQVFIATTGELTSQHIKGQSLGAAPAGNVSSSNQTNKFELIIDNTVIIEGYGRVNSYNSSSNNNYINTIDYAAEIAIEEHKSLFNNNDTRYLISSYTDTLSIEPIEDSQAFNASDSILNAYFGRNYFSNQGNYFNNQSNNTIYRLSRNISAVGKHSNNINNNPVVDINTRSLGVGLGSAFSNARYYVLDRLKHFPTEIFMTNGYITTNRVKVIEANESDGSFSITETSMAINYNNHPPWIDDWTAEISFDSTFLQTIRINGTIKGLETYGLNIREENAAIMDGSQPGSWGVTQGGAGPSLDYNDIHSHAYSLPDIITPLDNSGGKFPGPSTLPSTNNASIANANSGPEPSVPNPPGEVKIGKYQNAVQAIAWLKNSQSNPYENPIFKRAELFAANANANSSATHINPYKWLNNTRTITERTTPDNIIRQLNPIPVSMTESHRKNVGEIDYSFEFNNRPLNLIAGSVSETLSISDTFPSQQIAEIFVLGRKLGPVLQDLGTVTSSVRDVNFEVVLPRPRILSQRFVFPTDTFNSIVNVVEQLNPKYTFGTSNNNQANIKSYVTADTQTYDPLEGRIRVQKTWVWQRAK